MGVDDTTDIFNSNLQIIQVQDKDVHEDFEDIYDHNIAMLTLVSDVTLRASAQVVKLANLFEGGPGSTCTVTGNGIDEGGSKTTKLQVATLSTVGLLSCIITWYRRSEEFKVNKREVCAVSETATPCTGDNGGPLVCKRPLGA
ncbi:trypsin iota [Aplysia californica]|uniref:Trypsin iota n=1 Tax=Aplysia californica TaxID=6500 RepID=A0ABM0ZUN1_APLCA|nr:trypsin iota [Aplysia californica]